MEILTLAILSQAEALHLMVRALHFGGGKVVCNFTGSAIKYAVLV